MNEDDARATLAPHAEAIVATIEGGWQRYLDEGRPRSNPTTRANIVSDHTHDLAGAIFTSQKAGGKRKPMYDIGGVSVRFKLLKGGRSMNVATGVQQAIAFQDPLPLEVGPTQLVLDLGEAPPVVAKPPFITAGYELDRAGAGIASVVATLLIGSRSAWRIDLCELAAAFAPHNPVVTMPGTVSQPAALPAIVGIGESRQAGELAPNPVVGTPVPPAAELDADAQNSQSN